MADQALHCGWRAVHDEHGSCVGTTEALADHFAIRPPDPRGNAMTDPTPPPGLPSTPAEALRWAAERFGFGLENHPAKLTLLTWAKELDDAPTMFAPPVAPETIAELWDVEGVRWERQHPAVDRWVADEAAVFESVRTWGSLLRRGPLTTRPPAPEASHG